jgi:hypothetical protein
MKVDKIGRSHDGVLLAYGEGVWHTIEADGSFKPYQLMLKDNTVSEWIQGSFATRECTIVKQTTSCVSVAGAHHPMMNGEYTKILGGYRNKHNVWFMRSTAGQYVFVCSLHNKTKVLGVQNCAAPMSINVSICSSEIKALFQKKYWRQCKTLVWQMRELNNCPTDEMFSVEVREIERKNNGRKARSFVS